MDINQSNSNSIIFAAMMLAPLKLVFQVRQRNNMNVI